MIHLIQTIFLWAVLQDDGGVGAGLGAFAALDAIVLVDGGTMVHDGDGVLGAHFLATVHRAATTSGRDIDAVNGTFVAGAVDDLYDVGIALVATHRHLDAVLQDGAFLVDAAARFGFRTGAEQLGHFHISVLQSALVGASDDFFQHFVFDELYVGVKNPL